jgi:sister chromatid cohesion protein PDS5
MQEVIYPPGCKDIQVELANDELIRRLKVSFVTLLLTILFFLINYLILFLKKITQAFQNLDQSSTEKYKGLAIYLGCELFLKHENEDVQLYVACSLADIFRIYAPESPFEDGNNLREIFLFLANQLQGLKDCNSSNPSFKRYYYLLENLECVKTFQLALELDDSQEIISNLFENCFKIVNEKIQPKVKSLIFELLHPLLNESDHISTHVFDILFTHIIEPQKSNNKEACNLAIQLLRKGNEHFEYLVQNHLNNVLLSSRGAMGNNLTLSTSTIRPKNGSNHHATGSDDDDDDNNNNNDEDNSNDSIDNETIGINNIDEKFISNKLCLIIYELNTIRYNLLELVMPQLEYKLKSTETKERREYTKLLSKMFSEKDSKLAHQLPLLWESYLERFADTSEAIRKICVQHICQFLLQQSSSIKSITNHEQNQDTDKETSENSRILEQVIDQLKARALDTDESIRHEVLQEIIKAIKIDSNLITVELLNILKERTLDIKIKIRKQALQGLAALYKKIHSSKSINRKTLQTVNWIPSTIMRIFFQDSAEDKILVERLLNSNIVPYSLGAREKMAQLYYAFCTFDDFSILSLGEIMKSRVILCQLMKSIIDIIEVPNKTSIQVTKLSSDINAVAHSLQDPAKSQEFMKTLVNLLKTNLNLRNYFKHFVNPNCSGAKSMQYINLILSNLSSLNQANMTMARNLIERMSSLILDRECIAQLIELIGDKVKQRLTPKQQRMLKKKKIQTNSKQSSKQKSNKKYSDDETEDDEDISDEENSDKDDDDEETNDNSSDSSENNNPKNKESDIELESNSNGTSSLKQSFSDQMNKTLIKYIDDDGENGLKLLNVSLDFFKFCYDLNI